MGGSLRFKPITKELLLKYLKIGPLIACLCSTYLYREERKEGNIRVGHSVIIDGFDEIKDEFSITDPWYEIPNNKTGQNSVKSDRLVATIYLGEATYDCNIIQIRPMTD